MDHEVFQKTVNPDSLVGLMLHHQRTSKDIPMFDLASVVCKKANLQGTVEKCIPYMCRCTVSAGRQISHKTIYYMSRENYDKAILLGAVEASGYKLKISENTLLDGESSFTSKTTKRVICKGVPLEMHGVVLAEIKKYCSLSEAESAKPLYGRRGAITCVVDKFLKLSFMLNI